MMLRRSLAALAGASILLAGCGSDLPSKSEFIDEVKESMGSDVTSSLESAGIESAQATEIMENFIGCVYDEIKDDEDLLNRAYEDGGDAGVSASLETEAAACTESLTQEVTDAATAAAGG